MVTKVTPLSKSLRTPLLMGEAKAAMQDVQDMNDSSDDDITLDKRVQMLNMDQKRIYEKVKMHLLHLLSHESGECSCDFNPSECL